MGQSVVLRRMDRRFLRQLSIDKDLPIDPVVWIGGTVLWLVQVVRIVLLIDRGFVSIERHRV